MPEIITLKNKQLTAQIALKGAELRAFSFRNTPFLHDANPIYWNRVAPYLFPNVGALKNGQTTINGQIYTFPKHGFLRDREFELISQSVESVELKCSANENTLKMYPFAFTVTIKYHLTPQGLSCEIFIKNQTLGKIMPFNFGLHPAFRVPLQDNTAFEEYQIIFEERETAELPTVDLNTGLIDETKVYRTYSNLKVLQLNYNDYQNDALIFSDVKSKSLTLKHQKQNIGIKFSFIPFPTIAIWTPNHIKAPFIALEPWIGQADSPQSTGVFETKKDLIFLEPDEVFVIKYVLEPFMDS